MHTITHVSINTCYTENCCGRKKTDKKIANNYINGNKAISDYIN